MMWLLGIRAIAGKALGWITASGRNLLIVALAAALVWGWLGWRGKAKEAKVRASTEVALSNQIEAHGITVLSLQALTRAVKAQTAMVRAWSAESDRRRIAAQAALRGALVREKRSQAATVRIELERAKRASGGPSCPTGEEVLAAREFL